MQLKEVRFWGPNGGWQSLDLESQSGVSGAFLLWAMGIYTVSEKNTSVSFIALFRPVPVGSDILYGQGVWRVSTSSGNISAVLWRIILNIVGLPVPTWIVLHVLFIPILKPSTVLHTLLHASPQYMVRIRKGCPNFLRPRTHHSSAFSFLGCVAASIWSNVVRNPQVLRTNFLDSLAADRRHHVQN